MATVHALEPERARPKLDSARGIRFASLWFASPRLAAPGQASPRRVPAAGHHRWATATAMATASPTRRPGGQPLRVWTGPVRARAEARRRHGDARPRGASRGRAVALRHEQGVLAAADVGVGVGVGDGVGGCWAGTAPGPARPSAAPAAGRSCLRSGGHTTACPAARRIAAHRATGTSSTLAWRAASALAESTRATAFEAAAMATMGLTAGPPRRQDHRWRPMHRHEPMSPSGWRPSEADRAGSGVIKSPWSHWISGAPPPTGMPPSRPRPSPP
ncbi:hypothetical protein CXG81DRAFT_19294 [Caulochytrium protostelioides]|uniref:Uncharacterized protein n=1 Tax=Caulochytrium protostelioides TaxID=1555241 RepID=A0A4P9X7A7_9FUNG|nr:hypothetical protein CXG81DRAFT_19294 [Caulochytrium protostelioides]|eukprot:RKP00821.1 hypothetical protein CXG81DRAFT_19294 [Caulochytrium protostelioides]